MAARPLRRATLVALAVLITLLGATALPGRAGAEGGGDPMITSPAPSDPLYTGFDGPFGVDFRFAPAGTYTYGVTLLPPGGGAEQPVGTPQQYVSDGLDQASLTTPALGAGAYRFDIGDGAGHEASLLFTVRGPQPRCSVIMPSVVRVNAPEEVVAGRLGADCTKAGVKYASWDIRHASQGNVNLLVFNKVSTDSWKFSAGEPLGLHYAVPVSADAPGDDVVLQNVRRTTIRLVARQSLTAQREGRYVTLRGTLTRYTPSAFAFRGWRGRAVTIAVRSCGTCVWKRLAVRTTNVRGGFTLKVRSGQVRRYRVTAAGTAGVWTPAPAYVRR